MSGAKTPLQVVNEQHGGKEKLVDKLVGLIERGEIESDELKNKLLSASNQKLLRLLKISESVKQKYGTKEKLTQAVAAALGRAKDSDFVKRLSGYSVAKLLDMAQSLARRAGQAVKPTKEAKGAKKAAAAKADSAKPAAKKAPAAAKKPAAKKPAAKK